VNQARPLNIFISHASDFPTDWRLDGDGLIANMFIRKLAARGHNIHVAILNSDFREPFSKNVTLHAVDTGSRKNGPLARIRFALGVRKLLRQLSDQVHFDVIHQLNPVVKGLSIPLHNCGIPLVLGPYIPDWPYFLYKGKPSEPRLRQRIVNYLKKAVVYLQQRDANGIILTTPAASSCVPFSASKAPITYCIPYGVETSFFLPSPLPQEKSILYLGRITTLKGALDLLQAFRIVQNAVPESRLILAGNGAEQQAAQQLAACAPNPDAITFYGTASREEIVDLMQKAWVCCMPSYGEPFGLVALEVFSSARPLVGTNSGGLEYLITDDGGIRCAVGDIHALASALIQILQNREMASSMGAANRALAVNVFDWKNIIPRVEAVYAKAAQHYQQHE